MGSIGDRRRWQYASGDAQGVRAGLAAGRPLAALLLTEQARQTGRSELCTRAPHCEMPFEPRFSGLGPAERGFVRWRCSVAADSITMGPINRFESCS